MAETNEFPNRQFQSCQKSAAPGNKNCTAHFCDGPAAQNWMWQGQKSPQTIFGPTQADKYSNGTLHSSISQESVTAWMSEVPAELREQI